MTESILGKLSNQSKLGKKQFAVLVDPDKTAPNELEQIAAQATDSSVDWLLVGSSLLVDGNVDQTVRVLKDCCDVPIVLFPGNPSHVSPFADGILLLSLISGRNPELLIGSHVVAAPMIKKSGLEVLPTGYMLVDGGRLTSVHYMSNTLPIPRDKNDIAVCTALAGELLGLKCIYMDAGSGATQPISKGMISEVKNELSIPLIVGGGIKTVDAAIDACDAGADMLVVGSAIESKIGKDGLIKELSDAIKDFAQ